MNPFTISIAPPIYPAAFPDSKLLLLRDCFFLNKALPGDVWTKLFPEEIVAQFQKGKLLTKSGNENWCFLYRIVPYGALFLFTSRYERNMPGFTYLSYDSIYFADFLNDTSKAHSFSGERALDLCCGVGIQSFTVRQYCRQVLGSDINPDAVKLAGINSQLNNIPGCTFKHTSLFRKATGRFDLIVANPPFIFSEIRRDEMIDSDGGEPFGLGVTLEVLDQLPSFLTRDGKVFILTRSPVVRGEDYLANKLSNFLAEDFCWIYHHVSDSVVPVKSFEATAGIDGYRNIVLEISRDTHREFRTYPAWHRKTSLF